MLSHTARATQQKFRKACFHTAWAILAKLPFMLAEVSVECEKRSKMEEFYKHFLKKNSEENRQYHKPLQGEGSNSSSDSDDVDATRDPTKIAFENDSLKLIVVKSQFKRQVNFKLDDHLYHLLIEPKKKAPIRLMDILDFLHAAIIHILDEIKHSYKPEEHNVAYLTLHQEPLISGLTTVKY